MDIGFKGFAKFFQYQDKTRADEILEYGCFLAK